MDSSQLESLRSRLAESKVWPQQYMFKFIVPNNNGKVEQVTLLMPPNGKTSFKHTNNLKYVSITCVSMMSTPDEIISVTSRISIIEGVITL